jgi:hypothetical protein
MNKVDYVLAKLRPQGGYAIWDNDFDTIRWDEGVIPLTRQEFDDGLLQVEKWQEEEAEQIKAEAEAKSAAKAALLAQLGITEEQAKLLLS